MKNMTGGPLQGVRVVEVASVVMGPFAGRVMAQLGAEVIRVEPPVGDVIRRSGQSIHPGMTGTSMSLGDGKRSIAIDLTSDEGAAELVHLIRSADLVLTNHLPKRRVRFGLDWESVKAVNPRAILCTAQGFATGSPQENVPAYDDTVQAASGTCDIYRKSVGEPRFSPYIMADKVSGLVIAYSCMAALYAREATGHAQWVDVPMVDVMTDFNLIEQMNDFTFIPPLGPAGWHRTLAPERRPHKATDGYVCVLPYSDSDWKAFLSLAGVVDSASDGVPYPSNSDRSRNPAAVQDLIATYVSVRSVEEVVEECAAAQIPVQRVNTIEALTEDPYLRGRGTVFPFEHPTEGPIWRTRPNIQFSETPPGVVSPATRVDEDRSGLTWLERGE